VPAGPALGGQRLGPGHKVDTVIAEGDEVAGFEVIDAPKLKRFVDGL
jgi:hypothetical protein